MRNALLTLLRVCKVLDSNDSTVTKSTGRKYYPKLYRNLKLTMTSVNREVGEHFSLGCNLRNSLHRERSPCASVQ